MQRLHDQPNTNSLASANIKTSRPAQDPFFVPKWQSQTHRCCFPRAAQMARTAQHHFPQPWADALHCHGNTSLSSLSFSRHHRGPGGGDGRRRPHIWPQRKSRVQHRPRPAVLLRGAQNRYSSGSNHRAAPAWRCSPHSLKFIREGTTEQMKKEKEKSGQYSVSMNSLWAVFEYSYYVAKPELVEIMHQTSVSQTGSYGSLD